LTDRGEYINNSREARNADKQTYQSELPMFLFYYNLLQSDTGKKIYQILKNEDFPIFKNANAIIDYVNNHKQILQILNPQSN
jgi:GH35 family endo-1,4-beta-xylanase